MSKKILIIDDDRGIVDLMSELFKMQGYTILKCGDGEKALDLLEKEKPDLVFLDINMPRVNGLTVLACANNLGSKAQKKCPVVIITGERNLEPILQGKEVAEILYKPFEVEALNEIAKRLLS